MGYLIARELLLFVSYNYMASVAGSTKLVKSDFIVIHHFKAIHD